jgi:HEAT repeat protein
MGSRRAGPVGDFAKEVGEGEDPQKDGPSKAAAADASSRTSTAEVCAATKAKIGPITAEQATELEQRTEKEETCDIAVDLEEILLGILRTNMDPEICTNACKVLIELSIMHVRNMDFAASVGVIRRMAALAADETLDRNVRAQIAEQLLTLAEPSRVVAVVDTLRNHEKISEKDLSEFLMMLPSSSACDLCELLQIERYATVAASAIKHLVKDHPEALVSRIVGRTVQESLNVLRIIEELGSPAVVQALAEPLQSADDMVKTASVKLLTRVKNTQARTLLVGFLSSPNAPLRKATLRGLIEFGAAPGNATPLRKEAESRNFHSRSLDEKKAHLEAIAKLESSQAVDFLAGVLGRRRWFEKGPVAETRACAALALGQIDDDRARTALQRSASDRSRTVRAAVSMALDRQTETAGATGR